jgi:23S rRNA pseudouridine2605 synthase
MPERLQKLIAQAGIASRRGAEELIRSGDVTVNGEIITELGTKADPETDHIKVKGKLINRKIQTHSNVYLLLNKPKGVLSSAADPEGRKLVTDMVKGFGKLHPVGRLDFNSEGLIILTNDGVLTNTVASSKKIPKIYEVKVKGLPPAAAINKLRRGVLLEDGFKTSPAEIRELPSTEKNGWYEVTLFEGHNQQIRKMFDAISHSVVKLRRIAIGNIRDPYLRSGSYRKLTEEEIKDLSDFKGLKKAAEPRPRRPERPAYNKPPAKPARRRMAGTAAKAERLAKLEKARTSELPARPERAATKQRTARTIGARPSGKGPGRP